MGIKLQIKPVKNHINPRLLRNQMDISCTFFNNYYWFINGFHCLLVPRWKTIIFNGKNYQNFENGTRNVGPHQIELNCLRYSKTLRKTSDSSCDGMSLN